MRSRVDGLNNLTRNDTELNDNNVVTFSNPLLAGITWRSSRRFGPANMGRKTPRPRRTRPSKSATP